MTILHSSGNPANYLVIADLDVGDVVLGALGFDILLGRDVLSQCDFNYLGRKNTFKLTY